MSVISHFINLEAFFSWSIFFKLIVFSLFAFTTGYLCKIWYSYRFFKQRGISYPKYEFFFGNREIREHKNYTDQLKLWTKMFGKTYGYFEGHLPILVTSDLDLIQEIFIKQYSNFAARKRNEISGRDNRPGGNLFSATNLGWKRMRSIMNPTFSSSKMRELGPVMSVCADRLIKQIESQTNKEILVYEAFKRYTMDTIWNCAFGLDIDCQRNKDTEYFHKCELVFKQALESNLIVYLGLYFHEFKALIFDFLVLSNRFIKMFISDNQVRPYIWMMNKISGIIDSRKQSDIRRKDYIQLLLDAQSNETLTSGHQIITQTSIEKKMSTEEIKSNLILFMLAGYETTSTALQYSTFILATHYDEQQKIYDEIITHFNSKDIEPNYDNMQTLEYMDMFIKEVLRMYPIAGGVVARRCTRATNIKGIDIPLDFTVAVDVLSLHFDKEIWGPVDPNEFYPSRFSPEIKRNPLAYMPFGNGPRNCIGMKFALIELKLALVKLLLNYEIHPCEKTPAKLEFIDLIIRIPRQSIPLVFKKRI